MKSEASGSTVANDSSSLKFPFQSDYDLSLQIKRPKYHDSILVDKSLTKRRRRQLEIGLAEFTVGGLQKLLQIDDPEGYAVLKSEFSEPQWSQLLLSIEMGSSAGNYDYFHIIWDAFDIANGDSEEKKQWALELHRMASDFLRFASQPVSQVWNKGVASYIISARNLIDMLYCANEVVRTLSVLCESTNEYKTLFRNSNVENLHRVYEALRPAADLWRTIPDAAITPFITINEEKAIEPVNLKLLFDLNRLVSSKGAAMDLSSARSNELVAEWWKWTSSGFDYDVHYGVTIFDTPEDVQMYINHLKMACNAFDPTNETNIKVLDLFDDERSKDHWWDGSPAFSNLGAVHKKLLLLKEYVEKTLLNSTDLHPNYGNSGSLSKPIDQRTYNRTFSCV